MSDLKKDDEIDKQKFKNKIIYSSIQKIMLADKRK